MATSVPDRPTFVTPSERDVWQKLCRQLDDDCVVLANYRLSDEHKDHEADLVALMPGSGIVVVEVKGGSVWVEPDGRWMITRQQGPTRIHPVDQARDALYALRRYVESDPRWVGRTRIRWSHHVVLARTVLATTSPPRIVRGGRSRARTIFLTSLAGCGTPPRCTAATPVRRMPATSR